MRAKLSSVERLNWLEGRNEGTRGGSISCGVFDRYPLGEGGNIRERAFL